MRLACRNSATVENALIHICFAWLNVCRGSLVGYSLFRFGVHGLCFLVKRVRQTNVAIAYVRDRFC